MDKRIVVLAGKLHPFGGIETHLFHYCNTLVAMARVTLVITSTTYKAESIAVLRRAGVEVREFACAMTPRGVWNYLRCLMFLRRRHAPGLFYSNGTSGFSFVASLVNRAHTWVHHHHGDITPSILESFSLLYRRTLEKADWLILCTEGHANLIRQAYRRGRNTISLPYLKDEGTAALTRQPKNGGDKVVIGFFGRLRESKGIGLLLRSADWFHSHGIECRLHGDNCEGLIPVEVPPGISWKGEYDSAVDLPELLSDVDMVVLPSTFAEGLPIVMCEAVSRGVPVVCFPAGGLREMDTFHPGVMVVPATMENLKAGVLEMLERSHQRGFRENLAARYREQLSNQGTLDWWVDLLGRVE